MTMMRSAIRRLAFSGILLAVPFNPAFAQDATAVADLLKAAVAKQGIDISWTKVSGDASQMVLEGVAVKPASEAESLPIGNITLAGISEQDGGYRVETLTTDPFSKSEDGVSLDISSFVIDGMNIPAADSTDPLDSVMLYDGMKLDSMTAKVGDKTAFSMNGLNVEMTAPADGKPMEFKGAAEKFTADLTLVDDAEAKEVINALGYQNISGYLEMAGSWQPADGSLSLSQYDITIDNGGTLGLTFDLGGYTLDFIKSMQETTQKLAAAPAGGDNSAAGLAMLGLMQQLTLKGASIRFDDDSLTNKSLDLVATRSRAKRTDITNQAKAIVPFLTAQLNNPELAQQISTAVNAYLDNPKSIEVSAEPDAPVPFAQIAAGAMGNPLDLTKTLGVKVTANE